MRSTSQALSAELPSKRRWAGRTAEVREDVVRGDSLRWLEMAREQKTE